MRFWNWLFPKETQGLWRCPTCAVFVLVDRDLFSAGKDPSHQQHLKSHEKVGN